MPGDGDFRNLEAQLARDGEDFDVKTPTLQPLERENRLGSFGTEALEATLCVLQAGQDEQAHEEVIDTSDEMAVEGFSDAF